MYVSTKLKQDLIVSHIITVHYFEYTKKIDFKGEMHNFWEMMFVDNGDIQVRAGENLHILSKGEIIFHKPMEFHALKSHKNAAPNIIVISFESPSKSLSFFEEKIFTLNDKEILLLSKIVKEAQNAFKTPLGVPSIEEVLPREEAFFGAQQLVKISVEELLISLRRNNEKDLEPEEETLKKANSRSKNITLELILDYLEKNIQKKMQVKDICEEAFIGRSNLQKIFQETFGCGVIEYFINMKIEYSKVMIREEKRNFSEIASYLSFSSPAHFSKCFKQITRLSPSEYAKSAQGVTEGILTEIRSCSKINRKK